MQGIKNVIAVSLFVVGAPALAFAQGYDPKNQSPLTLLAAPKDALVYMDARAKAQALLTEQRAAEAEPLAEQITREYPRDGENWLLLANVKRALQKYRESAAAYEKAARLLWWGGPGFPSASAANMYLRAGDARAAKDMLRLFTQQQGNLDRDWMWADEDFASLRSDPEFREIAGRPDATGWTRDEGWRRDLDFLRAEMLRLNAEFRNRPLPAEFERRYQELKRDVPTLSDEQILVGMNRMFAGIRQGHTSIQPVDGARVPPKTLPFQFWTFPEGIFIVDAVEAHKDLIGSRLVSIEDVPAEDALRRLNEIQSVDGDNEYLYEGTKRLRSAPLLVGLGIAKSTDAIRLTLQKPGAPAHTITASTPPFSASFKLQPVPGIAPPLYLQETKQPNWQQRLPDLDALYVRMNLYDAKQADFALRLRSELNTSAPKNLIFDMRFNDGGSTALYAELLRTAVGFSLLPGRRVYVLIGRTTYSAAGNLITELEQLADAVFVGEASSECCTFYANPSIFRLPFSKLWGRMSTIRVNLSRKQHDFRREMNPDAPVITTADDYFSGRDPVMETVVRLIERGKATGR